jgi:aminoglycoside phosphotransferase (APT) family kinase protein
VFEMAEHACSDASDSIAQEERMRLMNPQLVFEGIFRQNDALPSEVEAVAFLHRHHSEVYRIKAGGGTYIGHLTPEGTEYLALVESKLEQLSSLNDVRIPKCLAAMASDPSGPLSARWAALVCSDIEGEELSKRSYNSRVWSSLCDLLLRVHELPATEEASAERGGRIDDPDSFRQVGENLQLLLAKSGADIGAERVRRHTDEMLSYVHAHSNAFCRRSHLIHGDLNRSNILVSGDRVGVIDWAELGPGDYAYDLATLKFSMDSVLPGRSANLLRQLARACSERFEDETLELRMRFFLALPGLISAMWYAGQQASFKRVRAWRVRTCYLHSEAQWKNPLMMDGSRLGAPSVQTEHSRHHLGSAVRSFLYLVDPRRAT